MRLAFLLAVGLALSGCVSTAGTLDSSADRLRLNERAAKRTATVTLVSGEHFRADGFRVDAESASWTDPATGQVQTFAREDVARVRFLRHGRGALEGAAIGAVAGFATGAALAVLPQQGRCAPEDYFCGDPTARAVFYGAATGVVSLVGGAGAGALFPNKLVWEGTPRRRP